MEFNFNIKNDRLTSCGHDFGFTGNVNTYFCRFEVECDIEGLIWFCVFKQGEKIYRQLIENGLCIIPQEVLKIQVPLYIGCYGTNADDEIRRISTNLIYFDIKQGAYSEATAPEAPSPDVWEILVSKTVPIIGENGNWYIYDVNAESYIDTGTSAKGEMGPQGVQGEKGDKGDAGEQGAQGEAGYTPQKGTDYFTETDKAEIVEVVKKDIDLDGKQDKTAIITHIAEETEFSFLFNENYNTEHRFLADAMTSISFTFGNSVYDNGYMTGLNFNSGETPTTIDYSIPENASQISVIHWVGVDCVLSSYVNSKGETVPISVFQPSSNKHYEVAILFNGTQFIGRVDGFVPALGNVVIE